MTAERLAPMPAHTGRILVVDADDATRAASVRVLRAEGYTVDEAADGDGALRRLHECPPHLLLLDVELPGLPGLEVLRRVKADPRLAGVIVVMTGAHRRRAEQQTDALDAGADGYIVQPVAGRDLVARVGAKFRQGLALARELCAGEARYRQIVDTAQEGLWVVDREGRTTFANARLEQMLGAAPGALVGVPLATLWCGELPTALAAPAAQAPPRQLAEGLLRRADGGRIPVQLTCSRLPDGEDGPGGTLAMVTDVSGRVGAEARLRLLEAGVSQLQDAVLITEAALLDEPGPRIVFANPAFERHSGYRADEVLGRSPRLLQCAATDRAELQRLREAMAARRPVRCLLRNVRKDGSEFWNEMDVAPVFDAHGECTHFVAVQRDVSDRQRLADEREAALQRLALAAEATGLGIWEHRLDSGLLFGDARAYAIAGKAHAAGGEHVSAWLALVHPEDRAGVEARIAAAVAGDPGPFVAEYRIVRPDGGVRHVSMRSLRIGGGSTPARLVGTCLDVTERRQAEAADRARELAERANRSKSEFIARVSHELRTPLNAILGFSSLLLDGAAVDPAEQQRQLRYIREAGLHLLALIGDLLDLSRIESGQLEVTVQPLAVQAVVDAVVLELRPLAGRAGITLHAAPVPRGLTVLADATRLRQVLHNLVSNAIKYNRPGGEVAVAVAGGRDAVRLTVRDTGLGMSAEQQAQLFQPFNRLGREGGPIEGTGIGLVITRQLVDLMGGRLALHSEPGCGSEFTLSLRPARRPAASDAPLPAPAAEAPARPLRVLYVDDDAVNRELMQAMLALRPAIELHCEPDGRSAISRARQLRPDIALLDMMLPDMDGVGVMQALRALPGLAALPCSAVTANAMPDEVDRARAAGMNAYLTKPLTIESVFAAIDALA